MVENDYKSNSSAKIYERGYRPWKRQMQPKKMVLLNLIWEEIKLIARPRWVIIMFIILRFLLIVKDILTVYGISTGFFQQFPFSLAYAINVGNNSMMGVTDLLLAYYVASSVISRDRVSGAYALYFSRDISRTEYLLVKFIASAFYMTSFTWLPAIYKYVAIGAFYDFTPIDYLKWKNFSLLLISLGYGVLVMAFLNSLILLLSMFVKKGWYIAIIIIPLRYISDTIAIITFLLKVKYAPLYAGPPSYGEYILYWAFGISNEQLSNNLGFQIDFLAPISKIGSIAFLIVLGLSILLFSLLYYKIQKLEVQ